MSSGVSVRDEVKLTFNDIKLGHKYRYAVICLTDDLKEIMIEATGSPDATYDEFVEKLKEAEAKKECRYGIYDAAYLTKDGHSTKNKLVLFMWSPDTAKIKQKMVYSSSMQALKRALGEGIAKDIQATDHDELQWDFVLAEISKMDRH